MNTGSYIRESIWVQTVKVMLLAVSALGYTWHLVDDHVRIAVVLSVAAASALAYLAAKIRFRIVWCVLIALIALGIGSAGSSMILDRIGLYDIASTILGSRYWYYAAAVFGITFLTRSLSLRWRTMQIVETTLILGSLVYLFFAHRDFNLTNPRDFVDYLYSSGYNPIDVYRWMGIGAAFLSLLMLLGRAHIGRVLYSIGVLVILALLAPASIGAAKLVPNVVDPLGLRSDDDNDNKNNGDEDDDEDKDDSDKDDDGKSGKDDGKDGKNGKNDKNNKSDDKNNGKGGGSGGKSNNNDNPNPNNPPSPVAVAVFYDEYTPANGILYFRQNVLSKYDGNHLVASTVDDDVISSMPTSGAADAVKVQDETLHTKISTSMFLMQQHGQPPQLAMGQRIFVIQNPDPAVFVSAYGVESLGMTLDISRFIGRHSIPETWSDEKRAHYLEIPDDPRYGALSDIIVRRIDPRFAGDDIVKALYIKSWLEKEGFYTLKTRHIDEKDPTASFLFGSMRGYCVHFAHSAALLLRSQGIAARVAIGYAVDNRMRGTNSAVLILGNQAHAWPEIYIDGVGWVTFDIYPENGDLPPRDFVDKDLASLFGELARDDKSGGKAPEARKETRSIPWHALTLGILGLILAALLGLYARKVIIIVLGSRCSGRENIHRPVRAVIFVWTMYGRPWRKSLSLEAFARDAAGPESATYQLVKLSAAAHLGSEITPEKVLKVRELYPQAMREASHGIGTGRKILGWINPFIF